MSKNLLIVESPAKAKTIEKILGKDFEVKSCYGHIRDLEKDDMGIDIKHNYEPRYIIPKDKEKVVKELKQAAKKSTEVWLASDEDREGESISWHLAQVLQLDPQNAKRIVFHEITPKAIQHAVKNPRTINIDLVNAQQARRVLDRLVGFELSPVLWKKIGNKNSLSAGRVQSVALRLIVDREREIKNFNSESSFKIEGWFNSSLKSNKKNLSFKAESNTLFSIYQDAEKFLISCKGASYSVNDIEIKPGKKSPSAPFTTSTLQQEASKKLGYSVSRTMTLAQKLYENGHITYMRTDSVSLSEQAIQNIKDTVENLYGSNYYQFRKFKNKNESAQEAHEAIRPTYMENSTVQDADCKKLYELIWKRTIACQMADARIERTIAKILISTNNETLVATGEVVKFDGFLKVYLDNSNDNDEDDDENEDSKILPPLEIGQILNFEKLLALEKFTRAQPRYTEAALVKKMEELAIGRPSTYAPTISTLTKRNYVEKLTKEGIIRIKRCFKLNPNNEIIQENISENTGAEKNKLFPTDLGLVVTDFLIEHFQTIMDFKFTAKIEEDFDEIALGKIEWAKMIDEFYLPFHKTIETTIKTATRASGERYLGIDPKSNKPVSTRIGRYGPLVQLGETSENEKARFASLQNGQSIETITLEDALTLFNLPRIAGEFENEDIKINIGKFGPYAQHKGKFYTLKKDMDPYTVSTVDVIDLINNKRIADDSKIIHNFPEKNIQVLNGQYGPYIKKGKVNYKLNKKLFPEPSLLTLEQIEQIILEQEAVTK
ncbi:MAG: type I DNA topoisomerase [Sediminibacterium sp.]|nr:type I DNA topoisomerase [Sediminibacterium sp.]